MQPQQYQVKEVFDEDTIFDYLVVNTIENKKKEVLLRVFKGDYVVCEDNLFIKFGTGMDILSGMGHN